MPELMDIAVGDLHFTVLLHAIGKTARDWGVIASGLRAERTVYAVDLRGHGASDWPGTYSLKLFTQDVIGILDQLDIGAVDLVGHSLGGLVPQKIERYLWQDFRRHRPPEPRQRPTSADARLAHDPTRMFLNPRVGTTERAPVPVRAECRPPTVFAIESAR